MQSDNIHGELSAGATLQGSLNNNTERMSGSLHEGSGGTSDYNELENKPSINNITLEGNITTYDLGIMPTVNYSETEHNTFVKWVDGKDIWRRVIYFTPPNQSNVTFTIATLEHYDELIKLDAMLYYEPYNQWLTLNYNWQSSSASATIFMKDNELKGQFANVQVYRLGKVIIEYTI